MSHRSNIVSASAGLVSRPLFVTSLVASLAASTMVGCSWDGASSASRPKANGSQYWTQNRAALADANIDPAAQKGRYDEAWFERAGSEEQLPEWYVAEAKLRVNELETERAEAHGEYVAQRADRSRKFAHLDAGLQDAFSREQMAVADAEHLAETYASDAQRVLALVSAREAEIENQANLGDAQIRATIREREAEYEKLRSEAVKGWDQAQAQHQRMKAERTKVANDGHAEIEDMIKIADMTERRTHAKLDAIRAEVQAVSRQSEARGDDLEQQIASASDRIEAQTSRLREQASALEDQSHATAQELRARAAALESGKTGANYEHQVAAADLDFQKVQADAEHLQQKSNATKSEVEAELERRFAFADKFLQVAEANYQQERAAIERERTHGLADVSVMRARADRLEREARADFILAQAQAKAASLREEAAHLSELADAEFEKVRAEAESEAARIQSQVMNQLAEQIKNGQVTFNNREQFQTDLGSDSPAPAPADVATVPTVVEPGHVAAFKTALGEAAMLRAQANAAERTIMADFQEFSTKVETQWATAQARHDEMIAEAQAFQVQGGVNVEELASNAETMIQTGEAEMGFSKADASSIKKEIEAAIINLRAEADATLAKADAAVTQLLSEAKVVQTAGDAEIQSLKARLNAVNRRGSAKVRQLRAEANSLETTQGALIAQMRQEIRSARAILESELARLDQAAESFIQIGEATYEETVASADSFNAKTKALVEQMYAENDAARLAAKADVEHLRTIARADEKIGLGQIERMLAQAEAETNIYASFDTARRAALDAQGRVAEAQLASSLAKSDAREDTVKAVFDTRLASVKADRNRAFARQFVTEAQRNARIAQATAAADAYRQLSSDAIAQLQDKRSKFETAAQQNWDSRLAMPERLLTDPSAGESWNSTTRQIGVASVPLED